MTLLCARDALSDRVIQVSAESRPADIRSEVRAKHPTHAAVFDNGEFWGVSPLEEIRFSQPERIFADLIPDDVKFWRLPTVSLDDSVEQIARLMDERQRDWIVALDADNNYAGIVTHESLLKALLRQTKEISRQKASEAEERFRWLLESTPDAMIIADDCGKITHVNAHVESTFGYKPIELVGAPLEDLLPRDVRQQHVAKRRLGMSIVYGIIQEHRGTKLLEMTYLLGIDHGISHGLGFSIRSRMACKNLAAEAPSTRRWSKVRLSVTMSRATI